MRPHTDGSAETGTAPTTLVLGCGALGRELVELVRADGLEGVLEVRCLPASLHNRPERIAGAVDAKLREAAGRYERVFVAYADCGTGGELDRVLEAHGVERLPGAHCYAFYAGQAAFDAIQDAEPGTFYLTDFLARSFDSLVIRGLGLDRHPHLLPVYFANYRRLVFLSQHEDPALLVAARAAADRLGLAFEHRHTGFGELGSAIAALGRPTGAGDPDAGP
ncbi:MAG: DUF1638 domain-containing protein [Chloroflexota bacterium]